MKPLFRWWTALESCKLLLISISLLLENRVTGTIFLWFLVVLLTLVSYSKIWPLFRKITNKLFVEDNLSNMQLLSRARFNLLLLMFFDLLPFIPFIQAILRYGYYRDAERLENIVNFAS